MPNTESFRLPALDHGRCALAVEFRCLPERPLLRMIRWRKASIGSAFAYRVFRLAYPVKGCAAMMTTLKYALLGMAVLAALEFYAMLMGGNTAVSG